MRSAFFVLRSSICILRFTRREEKTEHVATEENEQLDFGSLNQRYRNVKDKTDEGSQDRLIDHTERISTYSVSIGNAYGRWPVPDHHDKHAPPDFRAFWKDEGNEKSIREAQGMQDAAYRSILPILLWLILRADTYLSKDNVRIHG